MTHTLSRRIDSRIIKTEPVKWRDLVYLQQDDFKELSEEDRNKLKTSLLGNHFIQPFYVWHAPDGLIYCLDGRHRTLILEELLEEGNTVPVMLPAVFIDCADIKEAAKMVLIFSSAYARVTQNGLIDFMSIHDLSAEDMEIGVNLPEIDMRLIIGDTMTDFSQKNQELDIEEFQNIILLKLPFEKSDFLAVKEKVANMMQRMQLSTPSEVVKKVILEHA